MQIVLVTGGFDPIHSGHISYLNHADHLGDYLVVGLNSDEWLTRKKGKPFMSWHDRMVVLDNLHMVDYVIDFDDTDGTACDAINKVKEMFPEQRIIFANGGDRTATNIPEFNVQGVEHVFGVGGFEKTNSSSSLLNEWKQPKTLRDWGHYSIMLETLGTKIKELIIEPKQSLSLQRHSKRNEYWFVIEGRCDVRGTLPNGYPLPAKFLKQHDSYNVPLNEWHQLSNPYDTPCRILEIQYGIECIEEDVERK